MVVAPIHSAVLPRQGFFHAGGHCQLGVNGLINAMGSTDQERLAFFSAYFDTQQDYDIDITEFTAAVLALRAVEAVYNDNYEVLAKLWL